jgi:hypothetical protein
MPNYSLERTAANRHGISRAHSRQRPIHSSVSAVRSFLMAMSLSLCGHAAASTVLEGAVGLWQFPDRGVWVQVSADGSAFQCRYAPSGRLFISKGKFVSPHSIKWQEIWDTDEVSLANGFLTLSGKWGKFSYGKAKDPLYEKCLTPDSPR